MYTNKERPWFYQNTLPFSAVDVFMDVDFRGDQFDLVSMCLSVWLVFMSLKILVRFCQFSTRGDAFLLLFFVSFRWTEGTDRGTKRADVRTRHMCARSTTCACICTCA